jgi:hypothetical protein
MEGGRTAYSALRLPLDICRKEKSYLQHKWGKWTGAGA